MVNLRNGVSVALINNFFLSTNIIMPIQHISINSIIHSNKISSNKPYVYTSNVGVPRSIASRRAIKNRSLSSCCNQPKEQK